MSLFGSALGAALPFGIGGAMAGLGGGGYNGPQAFVPPNEAGMANQYQGLNSSEQALINQYYGMNSPYAGGVMSGANAAGGMETGASGLTNSYAGNLGNAANETLAASPLSPEAYKYGLQQNTDQANANEAARGITMSGLGAGLTNQSNQNFNFNWNNQQLARDAQALNAAGTGYGRAGALSNLGAAQAYQGGQYPLWGASSLIQPQLAGYQTGIGNDASYMGLANQGQNQMYNQWYGGQQLQNQNLAGLGQLAGTAASLAMFA
ncbi:MAG: hypothetical protein ACYCOR_17855 [Acidobacteriaceae bacterium]